MLQHSRPGRQLEHDGPPHCDSLSSSPLSVKRITEFGTARGHTTHFKCVRTCRILLDPKVLHDPQGPYPVAHSIRAHKTKSWLMNGLDCEHPDVIFNCEATYPRVPDNRHLSHVKPCCAQRRWNCLLRKASTAVERPVPRGKKEVPDRTGAQTRGFFSRSHDGSQYSLQMW